jgi:preprotein translocase subunit SecY
LLLKLNNAGLIPTVIAAWLIALMAVIAFFVAGAQSPLVRQLSHGHTLFIVLFGVLIVAFALFYAAFLLDPDKASETLARYGGVVRGVAAGEATAAYLDNVLTRVTLIGAVYLALLFVVPELLIAYYGLPFYLGGASFLMVVCAALDVRAQFIQEAQLRFGG